MMADLDLASFAQRGPGTYRAPCPSCDRGTKDTAMAITVSDRGIVGYCHRCGSTLTERRELRHLPKVAAKVESRPAADWRPTWAASKPITPACIAGRYLATRCCKLPPSDGDLRWHPAIRHSSGYTGPALIGKVTDALTRADLSLHRTWITETGKADVVPVRACWPGHKTKNGVIRLWPDEDVTAGLGIAEGIETALSLAWGHTPVWSCIDKGHLSQFPSLLGIESLVIAADNDVPGRKAATECGQRWADAGAEVTIVMAPTEGADLNTMVTA